MSLNCNFGYAGVNESLKVKGIFYNKDIDKSLFKNKGLQYISHHVLENLNILYQILSWNISNAIYIYRLPNDLFPWMEEYDILLLPDHNKIKYHLNRCGEIATNSEQRLTFNPGSDILLSTGDQSDLKKSINYLNQFGLIMDMMGLSRTTFNKINIQVGNPSGNKNKSMELFCENIAQMDSSVSDRLTLENDDNPDNFSITDLYYGVYEKTGIPLVFDYHHHLCFNQGKSEKESLFLALGTWDVKPLVHYSEPVSLSDNSLLFQNDDYIDHKIETYGQELDIMIEAKKNDLAVIRYKENIKKGKFKESL